MPASEKRQECSGTEPARCLTTASAVLFLGSGTIGLALCMALTGGTDTSLAWIIIAQALVVFILWPSLRGDLSVTGSPLVLVFLSVPLYVLGSVFSGAGVGQVVLTLVLLYMLFLYAAFMLDLEKKSGAPVGGWYIPISGLLVVGPVILYYVLEEFLRRPVAWIAGVSPAVAFSNAAYLNVGCAAWAGVLVVLVIAGAVGRKYGEKR